MNEAGVLASPQASPERDFLEALSANVPKVQRCEDCGAFSYPPRTHCSRCHGSRCVWVPMALQGTIYSFSNIPCRGDSPAYNVVLVDMADGFRLMSTCPDMQLDMSSIGMGVVGRVDLRADPPRLVFGARP